MATTELEYRFSDYTLFSDYISDDGLDRIAELTNNIRNGKEFVGSNYPSVKIDVDLKETNYRVWIKGKNKEHFQGAISDFMGICGVPEFVSGELDLVQRVLSQYGKTLKRKFLGSAVGKHVVDA